MAFRDSGLMISAKDARRFLFEVKYILGRSNPMKGKVAEFVMNCLFIFIFSYLLNFLWESFHAVALYAKHNFQSQRYVPMVSYVATVDGFLILGIYLFVAALWRNLFWLRNMKKQQILVSIFTGIAISGVMSTKESLYPKPGLTINSCLLYLESAFHHYSS